MIPKERRNLLNGADCSFVISESSSSIGGRVSHFMIARLDRVRNKAFRVRKESRCQEDIHIDCYQVHEEKDPFLDASALDHLDIDHTVDVKNSIQKILKEGKENGHPNDLFEVLAKLVNGQTNVLVHHCLRVHQRR